ncbi:MAG TPA: 4Fe-4S dicluster domain-containing protein [Crocinitomicaceae bacterium]|nr:4Fe-4S dicluster domain-containing protein [Crocinitomicaceae bacterium]
MSMIIFALLLVAGTGFFIWNIRLIRQNILLGIDVDRSDNKAERFKVMALIALGQKKMFKRPIPALLHLMIYASFCITQIELIEIVVDGLAGTHRIFRPALGGFYTFMISFIEVLSFLTFIATVAFLWRRNILKVPRLNMKELAGWAKLDANLILMFEIILLTCIFMMNGADEVLYQRGVSHAENLNDGSLGFALSSILGPALFGGMSEAGLHIVERIGWWGHILMVFTFLNYLPYSKHFHIVLAFPNTFFSNLRAKGGFNNLASVTKEVKLMLDPNADPYAMPAEGEEVAPSRFGARDVNDLTWKQLLDSYTCTECGRCTSVCPANITGKLLSPRKIMMDTRDRLTEYGNNLRKNGKDYDDGKSLHSYISEEELWACTSCNGCVDACPVNIDPLSIIVDLRRYLVMEESKAPTELTTMMTNIENNGAPWQFSPADRLNWKDE